MNQIVIAKIKPKGLDPHVPSVGLTGAYIQWGKKGPSDWKSAPNDGANGFAAAPTATNPNPNAISGWSSSYAPNGSWKDSEKTSHDPCPAGYRVPTSAQWQGVLSNNTISRTGSWSNSPTNYGSAIHFGPDSNTKLLTLPAAGYRYTSNGRLSYRGSYGYYWSSTELSSNGAYRLSFSSGSQAVGTNSRTSGFSVRCISE